MIVNIEVVMTPEEYEEAKEIQKEHSRMYDTLEALVFEWVDTDFAEYAHEFNIVVKEDNNGEMENCSSS